MEDYHLSLSNPFVLLTGALSAVSSKAGFFAKA
jgi:hypothetical protein